MNIAGQSLLLQNILSILVNILPTTNNRQSIAENGLYNLYTTQYIYN